MIAVVGMLTLLAFATLAVSIPIIVFLDRNASYALANVLAVNAVVMCCIVLAGCTVLVMADGRPS